MIFRSGLHRSIKKLIDFCQIIGRPTHWFHSGVVAALTGEIICRNLILH